MADVEGSDQRGDSRGRTPRHELRDRPPGPEPSTYVRMPVPRDWPEAVAYRAGFQLAAAEEDTVPQLLRLGGDITAWLSPKELGAQLELGSGTFERWLRWGWQSWEHVQEGR